MDKASSIESQLEGLRARSLEIDGKLEAYYSELARLQTKHHYNDLSAEQRRLENDIYTLDKALTRERVRELVAILSDRISKDTTSLELNAWLDEKGTGIRFVSDDPYGLVKDLSEANLDNYIATRRTDKDRETHVVTYGRSMIVIPGDILNDLDGLRGLCGRPAEPEPLHELIEDMPLERKRELYAILKAELEPADPNSESN